MKIVVLDGHTANPGDLSWGGLAALGALTVYDRTPPEAVVARAGAAEIVLTNKTVLGAAELAHLPRLACIGVLATGFNVVDVAAARERRIVVTNVPAYSTESVAQAAFALLLAVANRTGPLDRAVHDGAWCRAEDFCFWDEPLIELAGLTLGIVGFGAIGQAVARRAIAFGMDVIVYSRTPRDGDVDWVATVEEIFTHADVVSLHCPLTAETESLVNEKRLALMKPGSILINTGRGGLLDEAAVAAALAEGRLGGVGLDVLSTEPPLADNPLLAAPRCTITPHVAWATAAARRRLIDTATANVAAFLAGEPQNVVS